MSDEQLFALVADLLQDAGCKLSDPSLRRAWGRKRRLLLDALIERGVIS